MKIKFSRISGIEIKLRKGLKNKGFNNFVPQYPFIVTIIDIAFPEKKLAIYADGDYWHNLPSYKKRDKKINKFLESKGWKVLRFWEHDINKSLNNCISEIEKYLKT